MNMIHDTKLRLSYCIHSHDIFGENLIYVKGKPVRKKSERVEVDYVAVLNDVIKNDNVALNVDVMFISGLSSLVTHSRRIGLVTTKYLPGWPARMLHS